MARNNNLIYAKRDLILRQLDFYFFNTAPQIKKAFSSAQNQNRSFWDYAKNYVETTNFSDAPEQNWRRAFLLGAPVGLAGLGIGGLFGALSKNPKKNTLPMALLGLGIGSLAAGVAGYYGHKWMPQVAANAAQRFAEKNNMGYMKPYLTPDKFQGMSLAQVQRLADPKTSNVDKGKIALGFIWNDKNQGFARKVYDSASLIFGKGFGVDKIAPSKETVSQQVKYFPPPSGNFNYDYGSSFLR